MACYALPHITTADDQQTLAAKALWQRAEGGLD
jgi:hypothetical protein